jgi:hypothetical protein
MIGVWSRCNYVKAEMPLLATVGYLIMDPPWPGVVGRQWGLDCLRIDFYSK